MIGTHDPYYSRTEISNSDLSAVVKYFMPQQQQYDIQAAYRFGNLIDAMITEPHRVDHYRMMVDGEQFDKAEWNKALCMLNAFRDDPVCANLMKIATGQKISTRQMDMEYNGVKFGFHVRCKWDLWMEYLGEGGDIKSTTATSQQQFEASIKYFNYDQQRAFYMDIENTQKDLLIGISKVNFKIFKVPIVRGSELYNSGREKYLAAAFKYWALFDNF